MTSSNGSVQVSLDNLIADFNDHPTLAEAIFTLGEKYYNEAFWCENDGLDTKAGENFIEALTVWEKIITELPPSPFTPQAYYLSAVCYRRIGEYENAIEYCQKVVTDWPDHRRAWHAQFMIGRCYEKLEQQGSMLASEASLKIKEAYQKLLESYPECIVASIAEDWLNRAD